MVSGLLLRGLLAGILAGVLAAGISFLAGEPSIERAIAFETALEQAAGQPSEPEIVSRSVQRGAGLLTAYIVYGAAIGGLFSLVFALAYGRVNGFDPKALAALLAFAALPLRVAGVPLLLDLHEAMPEFFRSRFPRTSNPLLYRFLMIQERLSIWVATSVVTVNEAMADLYGLKPSVLISGAPNTRSRISQRKACVFASVRLPTR